MMKIPVQEIERRYGLQGSTLVPPNDLRSLITPSGPLGRLASAREKLRRHYEEDLPAVQLEWTPDLIDAYCADYLPRYFFIPILALRDLGLNIKTAALKRALRILDVGCGPGSVSLGLLHFYLNTSLSDCNVEIVAVDKDEACLERQRTLFTALRPSNFPVGSWPEQLDVTGTAWGALRRRIGKSDLVFCSYLLNEIPEVAEKQRVFATLLDGVAPGGSLVVAEPGIGQRWLKHVPHLVRQAIEMGWTIYYPCSRSGACTRMDQCWMRRSYDVQTVIDSGRLLVSTLILNKGGLTIFDDYKAQRPDLEWRSVTEFGKDTADYEVCRDDWLVLTKDPLLRSGALVGLKWAQGKPQVSERILL